MVDVSAWISVFRNWLKPICGAIKSWMLAVEWEKTKERYELVPLPTGDHAYHLKDDKANGEPPHYICATCYEKRKKSILNEQSGGSYDSGYIGLRCPSCNAQVTLQPSAPSAPKSSGSSHGWMGR